MALQFAIQRPSVNTPWREIRRSYPALPITHNEVRLFFVSLLDVHSGLASLLYRDLRLAYYCKAGIVIE